MKILQYLMKIKNEITFCEATKIEILKRENKIVLA